MSQNPSDRDRPEIERIIDELLRYLEANPGAKDTKEGIAKWWISRQRIDESIKAVEAAIALLVERGEVSESTLADGTKVYGHRQRSNTS
jgi:xanthine dehydrogenase iron-sulfur cluster and FAD-binding subunit A